MICTRGRAWAYEDGRVLELERVLVYTQAVTLSVLLSQFFLLSYNLAAF